MTCDLAFVSAVLLILYNVFVDFGVIFGLCGHLLLFGAPVEPKCAKREAKEAKREIVHPVWGANCGTCWRLFRDRFCVFV